MLLKQTAGLCADFADESGRWSPQICCRIRHIVPGMDLAQLQRKAANAAFAAPRTNRSWADASSAREGANDGLREAGGRRQSDGGDGQPETYLVDFRSSHSRNAVGCH